MTSPKTQLYCLIGDPVDHSLSPFILNRAFSAHGIDAFYVTFAVESNQVVRAVQGLQALGTGGANVTYPHKQAVLPAVTVRAPAVEVIGAANLLTLSRGSVEAENTDASGTALALTNSGVSTEGKNVFIFGAGGAARAAAYGVLDGGARSVVMSARDPSNRQAAIDRLQKAFPDPAVNITTFDAERSNPSLEGLVRKADIVINASPVGMGRNKRNPIEEPSWLKNTACCFEFVYHPRETRFLDAARSAGVQTIDGITLLVCTAQYAFSRWTGLEFDLEDMIEAASSHTADRGIPT